MNIRINLINQRKKKGLTQAQLSKILSITERQYQRIEAGTSNGSIDFWLRAKNFFNQSIDYLLEQEADYDS